MSARLSEQERANRTLTGAQFQKQITDLAEILGWLWMHIRPARTVNGWRTPIEGPLGKGWEDLFLAHPGRGRHLWIEVKREIGDDVDDDQAWVHSMMRQAGCEVMVARPSDWERVVEVLR